MRWSTGGASSVRQKCRRKSSTSLNKAIAEILKEPATREKLNTLGYEMTGSTPQEFADYVKAENVKWADVIKSQGLTPN